MRQKTMHDHAPVFHVRVLAPGSHGNRADHEFISPKVTQQFCLDPDCPIKIHTKKGTRAFHLRPDLFGFWLDGWDLNKNILLPQRIQTRWPWVPITSELVINHYLNKYICSSYISKALSFREEKIEIGIGIGWISQKQSNRIGKSDFFAKHLFYTKKLVKNW
jgi:hypothetical protein